MQDQRTWQELLGELLQDSQEKQRIANEMNISPATLMRWVRGESTPRARNLRMLIKALPPQYQPTLGALLLAEIQGEDILVQENLPEEIPSIFYRQVIQAHVNLPQAIHFSSICDTILLQALMQLDPNRNGMEITIAQCMPPSHNNIVRSMRESIGRGTPPLTRELEQRTIFLGAESLAGYAATNGRLYTVRNREEGVNLFPVHWVGPEESAVACPIMRADTIAGCLLVSSIQPNYFASLSRHALVQHYADLLVIAFEQNQFYKHNILMLHAMPRYEKQRPIIHTFRNRVVQRMLSSRNGPQEMDIIQAEQQIWREIEQELLDYFIANPEY